MHMQAPYVFFNWKMYLNFAESMILLHEIIGERLDLEKVHLGIFPSTLALTEVEKAVRGSAIAVGAQNVYWTPKGAYTGAVSAHMLKEAGVQYALIGHSESRYVFGESNDDVHKKMEACFDAGITPVLCVGETAEDRAAGKREYRIKKELMKALEGLEIGEKEVVVAYEPLWAIGTGEACDPLEAEEVHRMIKDEMKQYVAHSVPVLYGGSVTAKNVVSYLAQDSIEGVLVGGDSTKPETALSLLQTIIGR